MILRMSALTVAVLCLFIHDAGTYPSGAPEATCGDMVPRHGSFVPQTDPSPFAVSPSTFEVVSGNRTRLMLSSRPGVSYAGFMLQAHSPLMPGEVMGIFTNLPDLAKAINCGNNFQVFLMEPVLKEILIERMAHCSRVVQCLTLTSQTASRFC